MIQLVIFAILVASAAGISNSYITHAHGYYAHVQPHITQAVQYVHPSTPIVRAGIVDHHIAASGHTNTATAVRAVALSTYFKNGASIPTAYASTYSYRNTDAKFGIRPVLYAAPHPIVGSTYGKAYSYVIPVHDYVQHPIVLHPTRHHHHHPISHPLILGVNQHPVLLNHH